ncbi:MAG: molybdenum cofactor biosynthesis protein B [Desulfobacteraceae bacterium]|jgi:molybdenum cofactor biosynthesis protein B
MGHTEHRKGAPESVKLAILTVSTTRTLEEDQSGHWMAGYGAEQGHRIVAHELVTDQTDAIRNALMHILADHCPQAVIVTGGTGITPQDVTIEALRPLFAKELTAFAILFTQLSYAEINSAALLSRASAGVIGQALIFCIPGSLNACKLACRKLIFPELGHLIRHSSGK